MIFTLSLPTLLSVCVGLAARAALPDLDDGEQVPADPRSERTPPGPYRAPALRRGSVAAATHVTRGEYGLPTDLAVMSIRLIRTRNF